MDNWKDYSVDKSLAEFEKVPRCALFFENREVFRPRFSTMQEKAQKNVDRSAKDIRYTFNLVRDLILLAERGHRTKENEPIRECIFNGDFNNSFQLAGSNSLVKRSLILDLSKPYGMEYVSRVSDALVNGDPEIFMCINVNGVDAVGLKYWSALNNPKWLEAQEMLWAFQRINILEDQLLAYNNKENDAIDNKKESSIGKVWRSEDRAPKKVEKNVWKLVSQVTIQDCFVPKKEEYEHNHEIDDFENMSKEELVKELQNFRLIRKRENERLESNFNNFRKIILKYQEKYDAIRNMVRSEEKKFLNELKNELIYRQEIEVQKAKLESENLIEDHKIEISLLKEASEKKLAYEEKQFRKKIDSVYEIKELSEKTLKSALKNAEKEKTEKNLELKKLYGLLFDEKVERQKMTAKCDRLEAELEDERSEMANEIESLRHQISDKNNKIEEMAADIDQYLINMKEKFKESGNTQEEVMEYKYVGSILFEEIERAKQWKKNFWEECKEGMLEIEAVTSKLIDLRIKEVEGARDDLNAYKEEAEQKILSLENDMRLMKSEVGLAQSSSNINKGVSLPFTVRWEIHYFYFDLYFKKASQMTLNIERSNEFESTVSNVLTFTEAKMKKKILVRYLKKEFFSMSTRVMTKDKFEEGYDEGGPIVDMLSSFWDVLMGRDKKKVDNIEDLRLNDLSGGIDKVTGSAWFKPWSSILLPMTDDEFNARDKSFREFSVKVYKAFGILIIKTIIQGCFRQDKPVILIPKRLFSGLLWDIVRNKGVTSKGPGGIIDLQDIYSDIESISGADNFILKVKPTSEGLAYCKSGKIHMAMVTNPEEFYLVPEEEQIPIDKSNMEEFVREYMKTNYVDNRKIAFEAIKEGFTQGNIHIPTFQLFDREELLNMYSGNEDISFEDIKQIIVFNTDPEEKTNPYTWEDRKMKEVKGFLMQALKQYASFRKRFLRWVTGFTGIPMQTQGKGSFQIYVQPGISDAKGDYTIDSSYLPLAATCFTTLKMPYYPTKEVLISKLLLAFCEKSFQNQ